MSNLLISLEMQMMNESGRSINAKYEWHNCVPYNVGIGAYNTSRYWADSVTAFPVLNRTPFTFPFGLRRFWRVPLKIRGMWGLKRESASKFSTWEEHDVESSCKCVMLEGIPSSSARLTSCGIFAKKVVSTLTVDIREKE